MNPLPLVTIGVRLLGLILIVLYAGSLLRFVGLLLYALMTPEHGGLLARLWDSVRGIGGNIDLVGLVMLALGLYLFLSGRWVIAHLTRGLSWPGGGTCPKCGYDITGLTSSRCPECGTKLPARPSP